MTLKLDDLTPEQTQIRVETDKDLEAQLAANKAVAETVKVELKSNKPKPDILAIFKEIDKMRTEGVPEEDVREAFAQYMEESKGNYRRVQITQRKSETMVPMPSQEEINGMYDKRLGKANEENLSRMYKNVTQKDIDYQKLSDLLDQIDLVVANNRMRNLPKTSKLKIYAYRAAYFTVGKFLSAVIWALGKCGIR